MDNLNMISANHNLLMDLGKDLKKAKAFLDATSPFGFTEESSTHLWVEVTVLQTISNIEVFKALLLAHSKDVDILPSHFPSTMRKNAPIAWVKLEPYVENRFRNSLAHGTWTIENKQVVLFNDADLIPFVN